MMGKRIATKIKEELKKMNNSKDQGYTKTYIPWRDNDGFSVECTRMDDDSVLDLAFTIRGMGRILIAVRLIAISVSAK